MPRIEDFPHLRVFEYILRNGPKTVFDVANSLKPKGKKVQEIQPNIFRIVKRLEKEGSVEISAVEESPRKKKLYVPTFVGLMNACGLEIDAKLVSKGNGFLDNWDYYYERWIVSPHFREQVRGFLVDAEMKKNPNAAMKVMKLYVVYVIACLRMFEEYKNTMPIPFKSLIGEMLMHHFKPEWAKKADLDFRKYIIPFRRNWENFADAVARQDKIVKGQEEKNRKKSKK